MVESRQARFSGSWLQSTRARFSRARGRRGGLELHGAVGDGGPEGRPDRALDQADFAAMGADKLGRDGKAEAGAAGASRSLKRLEQMRARLVGKAGAGVGTSITTTAPSRRPVIRT